MHLLICGVDPKKGLIEFFIMAQDRRILGCWMPNKYPDRARIEKIVKGKALDKDQFIALATAIPCILGEHIQGKPIKELMELPGTVLFFDWNLEVPAGGDQ